MFKNYEQKSIGYDSSLGLLVDWMEYRFEHGFILNIMMQQ